MNVSVDENELVKLVLWTNPPGDEGTGRRRSRWLLEQLEEHPSLRHVDIPSDEKELFKFSLKLKAVDRPGLYVAYLLALALDESWLGLFEQFSGFYKWSLCRV